MEKGLDSIEQSKNLISNPTKLETKSKNTVQELQEYMEKCVFKNPMPPECLVQNIRFNIMQSNPELAKKEVSFDAGKIKKTSFIDTLLEKNFISVFSDRFIINVIYIFLFIGQWLMLFLLFSKFVTKIAKTLYEQKFDLLKFQTWAINSAPILGVLGTIAALSQITLEKQNEQISTLKSIFLDNFFDATTTTILGGMAYVINLLIACYLSTGSEAKELEK